MGERRGQEWSQRPCNDLKRVPQGANLSHNDPPRTSKLAIFDSILGSTVAEIASAVYIYIHTPILVKIYFCAHTCIPIYILYHKIGIPIYILSMSHATSLILGCPLIFPFQKLYFLCTINKCSGGTCRHFCVLVSSPPGLRRHPEDQPLDAAASPCC